MSKKKAKQIRDSGAYGTVCKVDKKHSNKVRRQKRLDIDKKDE